MRKKVVSVGAQALREVPEVDPELAAAKEVSANLSEDEIEELHVARQAEAEIRVPRVASPKINSDFNVN